MASIKFFTDLLMSLCILARPLAEIASSWVPFQRGTDRNRNKEICFMHQLWHSNINKNCNYGTMPVITKIAAAPTLEPRLSLFNHGL